MYEYAPWSRKVLNRILAISSTTLPILDVLLGGACNLNCIYCDTPKYHSPCSLDIDSLERIIRDGNIEWVYTCGLGEPTAPGNVEIFKQILAICKKKGVKVSVFSNIVNLDDEILSYISEGTLNVLFKLDSFDKQKMAYLYGRDRGEIILRNYQRLLEAVRLNDGTTNLGASIVPTKVNYDDVYRIIDFCMEHGIFPLLGQLENAGKCSTVFEKMKLKQEELLSLRSYINQKYGVEYQIPVCPATISAMHITNTNDVIVDEKTGLSCAWFWLEDPKMITLGSIKDMSADEITKRIIDYRKSKFEEVVAIERTLESNPFGGCGGDAKVLLNQYISIAKY